MGYPMAMNLKRGLPSDVKFVICDVNEEAVQKFRSAVDSKGSVEVASNAAELIKLVVRMLLLACQDITHSR